MNICYCYNPKCNQKSWESKGKNGQYKYVTVSDI